MPNLSAAVLQQEIDYAAANDDVAGAFESYNLVKDWLDRNKTAKAAPQDYARYSDYLMKLKFLCLNYFDDVSDYYELLKTHFALSQEIPNFDLWPKIEIQLAAMKDLNDRDVFKSKLKDALERSDSSLLSRQKYAETPEMPRKVSDWIKDIVSNLGLEDFDKVKKMEYIANGRFTKLLQEEDRNKVRNLLDIYEKLKLSSKSPRGYENSVLMEIDGKVVIFNRGEVEHIDVNAVPVVKIEGEAAGSAAEITVPKDITVADLEAALPDYAEGSLEYKAIKQEISRLKAVALKQAQRDAASQSDVSQK